MKSLFLYFSFSLLLIVGGCDLYPQDDYKEYYVVESYLIADMELPALYLSTTAPVSSEYNFDDTAISAAIVEVRLLQSGIGSPVEQTFAYQLDSPGVFVASVTHNVLPTRTYQLHITIPSTSEEIIGHTIIPDSFTAANTIPNSVEYQSENQIEVVIPASNSDARQNYFIFTTLALEASVDNFTPVYGDFYDAEDGDELSDFSTLSSGIVSEGNFENNNDGTVTLKYPWLAVAFYGETKIVTNIIDENIYDFLRSQSVQLGGSSISPGEIPNVIYNIDGGIGVFGSIAADTIQTNITRPAGF